MIKLCFLLLLCLMTGCATTQSSVSSDYCLNSIHPVIPENGELVSKRIKWWLWAYEQRYYDAGCYETTKKG